MSCTDTTFRKHLELAQQGCADSMDFVACCYLYGEGTQKDIQAGLVWLERAATLGDPEAQIRLGEVYEFGDFVETDCGKAMEWYNRAESSGSFKGSFALALAYTYGSCVEKDLNKAHFYYKKAADQGHIISGMQMANIMKLGCLGFKKKIQGYLYSVLFFFKAFLIIVSRKSSERLWGGGVLLKKTPFISKLRKGTRFE